MVSILFVQKSNLMCSHSLLVGFILLQTGVCPGGPSLHVHVHVDGDGPPQLLVTTIRPRDSLKVTFRSESCICQHGLASLRCSWLEVHTYKVLLPALLEHRHHMLHHRHHHHLELLHHRAWCPRHRTQSLRLQSPSCHRLVNRLGQAVVQVQCGGGHHTGPLLSSRA